MKKLISATLIALFLSAFTLVVSVKADDKAITITGKGECAKCTLHETAKCQNAIETVTNGKTNVYYLVPNSVSKEFHDNLCKETQTVTATGTVKEKNGKMEMTASKLALAK